jgi:hypothetical protein
LFDVQNTVSNLVNIHLGDIILTLEFQFRNATGRRSGTSPKGKVCGNIATHKLITTVTEQVVVA